MNENRRSLARTSSRPVTAALTILLCATTLSVVMASPAAAASCPDNSFRHPGLVDGGFAVPHVRVRTGPSTYCPAPSQGEPGDEVYYFCWKFGDDGYTWTYLNYRNGRTGVWSSGWSRDDLLVNNGSWVRC
jgi:hypothetical protein